MVSSISSAVDTLSTLSSTAYMYAALLPNGSQNLNETVNKVDAVLENAIRTEMVENSSDKIYQEGDEGYLAAADLDQDGQHTLSELINYYMQQNGGGQSRVSYDTSMINNSAYTSAVKAYAKAQAQVEDSLKSLISVYA